MALPDDRAGDVASHNLLGRIARVSLRRLVLRLLARADHGRHLRSLCLLRRSNLSIHLIGHLQRSPVARLLGGVAWLGRRIRRGDTGWVAGTCGLLQILRGPTRRLLA